MTFLLAYHLLSDRIVLKLHRITSGLLVIQRLLVQAGVRC